VADGVEELAARAGAQGDAVEGVFAFAGPGVADAVPELWKEEKGKRQPSGSLDRG